MNKTFDCSASLPLGLLATAALAACGTATELDTPIVDAGPRTGAPMCPPSTDDVGLELGQTIPDLSLLDCEGTPIDLHEVCDKKAAYFFVYADW